MPPAQTHEVQCGTPALPHFSRGLKLRMSHAKSQNHLWNPWGSTLEKAMWNPARCMPPAQTHEVHCGTPALPHFSHGLNLQMSHEKSPNNLWNPWGSTLERAMRNPARPPFFRSLGSRFEPGGGLGYTSSPMGFNVNPEGANRP